MEWKAGLILQKDPDATLDYPFDWKAKTNGTGRTDWLESGETISSYVVTATGLTKVSESLANTNTRVVPFISGGVAGTTYTISCRITTNFNRIDERSVQIYVTDL